MSFIDMDDIEIGDIVDDICSGSNEIEYLYKGIIDYMERNEIDSLKSDITYKDAELIDEVLYEMMY